MAESEGVGVVVTRENLDEPGEDEKAPGVHAHAPTPNRANMRGGQSFIKAHATTVEAAELEERIRQEAPGRLSGFDPGEKPAPGSTPWQSKLYVSARNSADGHPYAIGDTVSEAEAARQGLLEPPQASVLSAKQRRNLRLCQRCEGRGTFSKNKPRGHKADCQCRFCGVCPACQGTRYEKEVA
jgi:hypothetical protein